MTLAVFGELLDGPREAHTFLHLALGEVGEEGESVQVRIDVGDELRDERAV
ncbi:MAG TPA: hypothetical protein VHN36_00930 [Ilumatobacteraceae bacterium]|nr:hypothetical protein [Ilumatobacteraceae bacterium]